MHLIAIATALAADPMWHTCREEVAPMPLTALGAQVPSLPPSSQPPLPVGHKLPAHILVVSDAGWQLDGQAVDALPILDELLLVVDAATPAPEVVRLLTAVHGTDAELHRAAAAAGPPQGWRDGPPHLYDRPRPGDLGDPEKLAAWSARRPTAIATFAEWGDWMQRHCAPATPFLGEVGEAGCDDTATRFLEALAHPDCHLDRLSETPLVQEAPGLGALREALGGPRGVTDDGFVIQPMRLEPFSPTIWDEDTDRTWASYAGGYVRFRHIEGSDRVLFHPTELETKRRVAPSYPEAARNLGLGDRICRAAVDLDPDGVPSKVEVHGCPKVFHLDTTKAVLQWRWYPPKQAGERVSARTHVSITYKTRR